MPAAVSGGDVGVGGPQDEQAAGSSSTPNADAEPATGRIHPLAYAGYYLLFFFAQWFGTDAFDADGDGDFDVHDVQCVLKRVLSGSAGAEAGGSRPGPPPQDAGAGVGWRVSEALASGVEGEAQEDVMIENLSATLPWFVITECSLVLVLWVVGAAASASTEGTAFVDSQGGLDSAAPGLLDLRWADADCADRRGELWRWLTYQFTHAGLTHVGVNVALVVMLGVPLEGMHGWLRLAVMFQCGVVGGALSFYVNDAHGAVVGCSGGCYALLGIHIADLVLNWAQRRFRLVTVAMLALFVALDVANLALSPGEGASVAAHVGGCIAGLIFGAQLCRNAVFERHEGSFQLALACVGGVLVLFAIVWLAANGGGPRSLWEALGGEGGWCSLKICYHPTLPAAAPMTWQCIRCHTEDCVQSFVDEWRGCRPAPSVAWCDGRGFYFDAAAG